LTTPTPSPTPTRGTDERDARLRVGAVSYLNTLPLVYGMEHGVGAKRVDLSYATPSVLATRMTRGELDVALLPVIELARIAQLEIVPGLGITTHGACRSVLLVSRRPADQIETLALDADSRTSNVLCRVLLSNVWRRRPRCVDGAADLETVLQQADAAVRIGDKALFEPLPRDAHVYDLGEIWTRETKLPFVFAAWTARAGVIQHDFYRLLHESRRRGSLAIDAIAEAYRWRGEARPEVAREYLTHNIRFRLGADELRAMKLFFRAAEEQGLIEAAPQIRLALERWTTCHETAAKREPTPRSAG